MTRAEFAKWLNISWSRLGKTDKESLMDFATRYDNWRTRESAVACADVATNGFDPEPESLGVNVARIMNQLAMEQSQEAAKRSRPFVGSHNLPVNLDWD